MFEKGFKLRGLDVIRKLDKPFPVGATATATHASHVGKKNHGLLCGVELWHDDAPYMAQCRTVYKLVDWPRGSQALFKTHTTFNSNLKAQAATVTVAGVCFEHPNAAHLLEILPPLILSKADDHAGNAAVGSILDFIAVEARSLKPGGEAVMTRLADVVIIQVIRNWIESVSPSQKGWLAALQDPQIGAALLAVHREPQQDWSVASLALQAGMSRSAFTARFTDLVGETAMRYVTRWRMNVAKTRLSQEDISLAALAEALGYRSEAAFCRTFKRYMGITPSAARKRIEAAATSV